MPQLGEADTAAICLAWPAGAVWAGSRRRSRSPAYKMTPLTVRKMAAGIGLPRTVRNVCSSSRPAMPTGMVARMISQASRWSAVLTWRSRSEVANPPAIRSQSRQK